MGASPAPDRPMEGRWPAAFPRVAGTQRLRYWRDQRSERSGPAARATSGGERASGRCSHRTRSRPCPPSFAPPPRCLSWQLLGDRGTVAAACHRTPHGSAFPPAYVTRLPHRPAAWRRTASGCSCPACRGSGPVPAQMMGRGSSPCRWPSPV